MLFSLEHTTQYKGMIFKPNLAVTTDFEVCPETTLVCEDINGTVGECVFILSGQKQSLLYQIRHSVWVLHESECDPERVGEKQKREWEIAHLAQICQ